jgi:phage-related protein
MAGSAVLSLVIQLKNEASKAAKEMQGDLKGVGKSAKDVVKDLGKIGGAIATAGLALATAGVMTLAGALTGCVLQAADAQLVQADLNAVLTSTGGIAGVTAQQANDLASSLQDCTRFEDDVTLAGENMLLTFTNIGADVFPMATEAMLNMATKMKTDPTQAAMQLGKALNDPVAGISALSRVGVKFTSDQKAMIKAMVEAGDVAGAQKIILKELETEFGGAARAAGETFAGKLDIIKNKLAGVGDDIGLRLLPGLSKLADVLIGQLSRPEIQGAIGAIANVLGTLAEKLGTTVSWLIDGDVGGALDIWFPAETSARIMAIATAIGSFVGQVATFVTQHAEAFKGALIAIGAVLAGAMIISGITSLVGLIGSLANPITLIILAAGLLGAAWASNWGGIQDKTKAVIDWISPYIGAALAAIKGWWDEHGTQVITTVTGLWTTVTTAVGAAVAWLSEAISTVLAAIKGWWTAHGEEVMTVVSGLWTWVSNAFSVALGVVSGIVTGVLGAIKGFWEDHKETISGVVTGLWEAIQGIFKYWIDLITGIIGVFAAAFKGNWEDVGKRVRELVGTLWEDIKTAFSGAYTALSKIVGDIIQSIKDFFTTTDWGAVGDAVVKGVGAGITGAIEWIKNAAKAVAQAAVDAMKGLLGISSPSKVMAEVGANMMQGLGSGIASKAQDVVDYCADVANLIVDTMDAVPDHFADASTWGGGVMDGGPSEISTGPGGGGAGSDEARRQAILEEQQRAENLSRRTVLKDAEVRLAEQMDALSRDTEQHRANRAIGNREIQDAEVALSEMLARQAESGGQQLADITTMRNEIGDAQARMAGLTSQQDIASARAWLDQAYSNLANAEARYRQDSTLRQQAADFAKQTLEALYSRAAVSDASYNQELAMRQQEIAGGRQALQDAAAAQIAREAQQRAQNEARRREIEERARQSSPSSPAVPAVPPVSPTSGGGYSGGGGSGYSGGGGIDKGFTDALRELIVGLATLVDAIDRGGTLAGQNALVQKLTPIVQRIVAAEGGRI